LNATLVALTASEFFVLVGVSGDTTSNIGRWTYDAVDARWTALTVNEADAAFDECSALLVALGLDPNSLTNAQLFAANQAMAWAICYMLLDIDAIGTATFPGEQVSMRDEFAARRLEAFNKAGNQYAALGVTNADNPYFNTAPFAVSVTTVPTIRNGSYF